MGNNFNLAIALLRYGDDVAEITSTTFPLDTVVEELLKVGNVEDLVVGRLGSVDDILPLRLI